MNHKLVGILTFLTIIFQHFQITSLAGFPVSLGSVTGIMLVLFVSRPQTIDGFVWSWCALICLSGAAAMVSSADADAMHYLRTLALFMLAVAIILLGNSGSRSQFIASDEFARAVFAALVTVVTLSVTQVIFGALKSQAFFNVFGSHQYLYEYNPHLEYVVIPRAQGFYLEPSYDAFIICTLSVVLFCLKKRMRWAVLLVTVGLLSCQSASGLLLMVVVLLFAILRSRPMIAAVSTLILCIVGWTSGPYLASRLNSIDETSTSANFRIVAPLRVLGDILAQKPLGEPLGAIELVMGRYGLLNGASAGTSLDNGFYVLVFYFGWIGMLFLGAMVTFGALTTVRQMFAGTGFHWVAPLWLLGSFMFSGGIMLPEFAIMTWLVIAAFGHSRDRRDGEVGELGKYGIRHPPIRRDRDIQRPRRTQENPKLSQTFI